uniref:Uncharacterized protein n=1 Tax=Polytomella parva TaxID=51329 RepID=A0A7S0VCD2_9CHLO
MSTEEVIASESGDEAVVETVKLGYRTFHEGRAAAEYLRNLLTNSAVNTFLPEYEHVLLLDLIKKGHKRAAEKIGRGVKGFQVRYWCNSAEGKTNARAFFLVRKNGSVEDFSYLKSLDGIFPNSRILSSKPSAPKNGHGGGRGIVKKHGGRGRGRK